MRQADWATFYQLTFRQDFDDDDDIDDNIDIVFDGDDDDDDSFGVGEEENDFDVQNRILQNWISPFQMFVLSKEDPWKKSQIFGEFFPNGRVFL